MGRGGRGASEWWRREGGREGGEARAEGEERRGETLRHTYMYTFTPPSAHSLALSLSHTHLSLFLSLLSSLSLSLSLFLSISLSLRSAVCVAAGSELSLRPYFCMFAVARRNGPCTTERSPPHTPARVYMHSYMYRSLMWSLDRFKFTPAYALRPNGVGAARFFQPPSAQAPFSRPHASIMMNAHFSKYIHLSSFQCP